MVQVLLEIKKEFNLLLNELKKYNKELLKKKFIIAITKCDLLEENKLNKLESNLKYDAIKISSISGFGLEELKDVIWKKINIKE